MEFREKVEVKYDKGKGFAITGMVLGIVSLFLFPFINAILAIIFGGLGRRHGMGIAGIVLGVISLIVVALQVVYIMNNY